MNDEIQMTNVELPIGWTEVTAKEVCLSVTDGDHQAPPQVPTGVPFITISAIGDGKLNLEKATRQVSEDYFDQLKLDRKPQTGDILFSVTGSIGRVAPVAEDCRFVFQRHIAILRPDETKSLSPYLKYALQTPDIQKQANVVSTGTAQLTLPLNGLRNLILPIAPLAEQKRIADKLEVVLGRVDACRARLDRVPALLKRFRQSVLAAATSGRLTAEWRMTNGVNDEWEEESVGSIITKIEAGLNVQCEERPPNAGEKGLVKISAVTWGTYDDEKSKTLGSHHQIPESTRIRVGDFLISRANTLELVGACVIVHKASRPVYLSDKILRLVMPEDHKSWVLMVLQSPSGRKQIEALATGNQLSMRNLAQANLRKIVVPNPELKERKEIVRRVEALFAIADRIEARLATAQKTVERLTPATLAKAFRGELVPQDPTDESASALLERLQSQPASNKPARAPRKTRK